MRACSCVYVCMRVRVCVYVCVRVCNSSVTPYHFTTKKTSNKIIVKAAEAVENITPPS